MMCFPDAWDSVWRAFDSQRGDRVRVPKLDLETIMQCSGRHVPQDMVLENGRRYVVADRNKLFTYLQMHADEPCKLVAA